MRVLVVGAGGYIGIPLCEEFEARGHHVTAWDRFYFGKYPKLKTQPQHIDIRDISPIPDGMYDTVVDLAGLSNDASADIDPDLTMAINLNGAIRLADLAKRAGIKKYVYSSSCSVYGHGDRTGLTEDDQCKPLTLYAECKVRVEDHLRSIADSRFNPVILRNATVFGVAPRMRFDLAVNIMTLRAWRDGVIYQMGGGEQWRPFVAIGDVVNAFCWALENEATGTFNVGHTGLNYSIKQLATIVQGHLPKAKIHRIPDEVDKRSYHVSFAKLAGVHKLPMTSVISGIRDITAALVRGDISGDDETAYTLQFYKSLMDWEKRLDAIRLDGRIL